MTTTTTEREGFTPSLAPVLPPHAPKSAALTERRRTILYRAQGGRCWYCDCVMQENVPTPHSPPCNYATKEHITPLLRSNKNRKDSQFLHSQNNALLVCWKCNNARGVMPLTTFIGQLRQSGIVFGIVSRIRRLVNDSFPTPARASTFEWYMLQALAHPRRPGDTLKRLPADLERAVLPDPAPPLCEWREVRV